MNKVDAVIKEKLNRVREYRRGLLGEYEGVEDQVIEKKKKHISFA